MTKATALYITDAQVAERIGISAEDFKGAIVSLERLGFPLRDAVFGNRRYWPAIAAFLDKRNGLASSFQTRNPAPLTEKDGKLW